MFHIFVALVAAGLTAAAAPSPSAPQGCPAGAVGIGGSQLCPETGSCAGLGLTATLYAAGSCTPVAHSTTIGNSAVCDDTFNNDGGILCGPPPDYNFTVSLGAAQFTNCVTFNYPNYISCDSSDAHFSEIWTCCS